ncbi:hypothetical protein [Agaribacter flavus]|uniref:Uncharacterized protein n=1 Tax=Agaribacter flavus TaxID=1902781 RepID=A0ABV7FVM5_9ALTE
MKELRFDRLECVSGGILINLAIRVVGATIAAYDASMEVGEGFEKGFKKTKQELKQKNGW